MAYTRERESERADEYLFDLNVIILKHVTSINTRGRWVVIIELHIQLIDYTDTICALWLLFFNVNSLKVYDQRIR